jgi:dienelactone hydrolase
MHFPLPSSALQPSLESMKKLPALLLALCAAPFLATAAIQQRTVEYPADGTTCEGFVAYDDSIKSECPAVLVVHDWMGLSDLTKETCTKLAKDGYIAMAADIYGKGIRPADRAAAAELAGKYKNDRKLLRQRVQAGVEYLSKAPFVAKSKIAVIGYCFGGTTAIELARNGAPLAGVVSFHGGLDSPTPADGKNIKAHMLVLHGADDPFVKADDIEAFKKELNDAKVDWEMVYYSGAVHAFTNPKAGNDNSKGTAYNEKADKRSWQAMLDFFKEIFG